jgi:S-adenosyl-L-methionine hydrolase (adenosine-forming)
MERPLAFKSHLAVAATAARDAFSGRQPLLSIITDFGQGDEAVYAIRSAAKSVAPRIGIESICDNVPPGNILVGAWRLKRAVELATERPGTAYVAVVDPGVGSRRRSIAVRTNDGKYLIGPDNGVLSLAFSSRGIEVAVEIENLSLTLLRHAQSSTFHGKDVFAPVAAHILRGVPIHEFGNRLDPETLARVTISSESTERSRAGCVVDVDGFGNVRTSVPNHIPEEFIGRESRFTITRPNGQIDGRARVLRTFADAAHDEAAFVLASTGCLDLVVNRGSAAGRFGISPDGLGLDSGLKPTTVIELALAA